MGGKRYDRLKEIQSLDPDRDFLTIYRLTATYEFPWDHTRALELALYRTYAVPSIGRLLAETAEMTERPQKRYDDTSLLLDAVVEHGFESEAGRTAIRRINGMHRSYDISDDDMRYVLCTFVVVPARWLDSFGWRPLSDHERRATAAYYRALGKHMGIKEIPRTFEEFEQFLNSYEAAHFAWDARSRQVADATLDLMASWYPRPLAPLLRAGTLALLDKPLRRAFRYPRPRPGVRALVHGLLRLRARAVRLLPPRRRAHHARHNPEIRSYPGYPTGYRLEDLGTFPTPGLRGCPIPHQHRPSPDRTTPDPVD
ncbi:oxygenase MpaB family protein [Streptomyces sp. NPDC005012]|uniref:oxygenase MpaB family protein n=1 Tax=Streptomyces sp. NPDC005012 TaxID=3154558 RepID=UPI0033AC4856